MARLLILFDCLVQKLVLDRSGYRPEQHYMRGAGPKSQA